MPFLLQLCLCTSCFGLISEFWLLHGCFFPSEARVAMDRADADATNFYTGLSASKSKGSSGNLKEVYLNETPSVQAKRLQLRLQALLKTVVNTRSTKHSTNNRGEIGDTLIRSIKVEIHQTSGEETGNYPFATCELGSKLSSLNLIGTCDLDYFNFRMQSSNPKETWHDAEIVVEGKSVAVNRSILSEGSQFFRRLFNLRNDGKPRYLLTDLVPHGKVGYEAFKDTLHFLYTGMIKESPPEVSTCVDDACAHFACPPAINYRIELMYASAAFQMKELVVLSEFRLRDMVGKAPVEDVIPILVAAFHCQLNMLHSYCIQRIAGSNLDNLCLEKELPDEVSREIKSLRVKSNQESEANIAEVDPMHAKIVRRIQKALDSDDVELLKLLLDVSNVTLDDAYALHYAAAYCNPKVFKEVLNMDLAGLNLKDARGRTVLHVAARRNEPEVMVTLLSKGACASETTSDGQTAVAICRRMTRRKDYLEATKQGQGTNKDRLCIDVLEREMRRNSMSENLAMPTEVMDDHFQAWLDCLENRVAFVRFFPSEARVAMEIAGADTATDLSALGRKGLSGNLKEIDLNETPSMQAKRRQLRLLTLLKTVETGERYFPHCSELVDRFLHWPYASTPEMDEEKLKVYVQEALRKDVAYHRRSGLPSSWPAFYKYMAESNQLAFYKYVAESNRSGMPTSSASSN